MVKYVIIFLVLIIVCLFIALFISRELYNRLETEKNNLENEYKKAIENVKYTNALLQKERENAKVKKSYHSGSDSDFDASINVLQNLYQNRKNTK